MKKRIIKVFLCNLLPYPKDGEAAENSSPYSGAMIGHA